jgi:hypothetical protein
LNWFRYLVFFFCFLIKWKNICFSLSFLYNKKNGLFREHVQMVLITKMCYHLISCAKSRMRFSMQEVNRPQSQFLYHINSSYGERTSQTTDQKKNTIIHAKKKRYCNKRNVLEKITEACRKKEFQNDIWIITIFHLFFFFNVHNLLFTRRMRTKNY